MKFEKPTILIEIGGCKVKGYMNRAKAGKLLCWLPSLILRDKS